MPGAARETGLPEPPRPAAVARALIVHRPPGHLGPGAHGPQPEAQRRLGRAFELRQAHKRYQAIVAGCMAPRPPISGTPSICPLPQTGSAALRVIDPVLGKPSLTRWRVLAHHPDVDYHPRGTRTHDGAHTSCGYTLRLWAIPFWRCTVCRCRSPCARRGYCCTQPDWRSNIPAQATAGGVFTAALLMLHPARGDGCGQPSTSHHPDRCLARHGTGHGHQLLHPGSTLLCISRTANPSGPRSRQHRRHAPAVEQDLTYAEQAAQRLRDWLQGWPEHFASATLINNAGVMPPIAPFPPVPGDLAVALRVGLKPMLLCVFFPGRHEGWNPLRKVREHFGLGRRPMASQAVLLRRQGGHGSFHSLHGTGRRTQTARCAGLLARPGRDRRRHVAAIALSPPGCFPGCAELCPAPARRHAQQSHDAATRVLAWLERPDFWRSGGRRCTGCLNTIITTF